MCRGSKTGMSVLSGRVGNQARYELLALKAIFPMQSNHDEPTAGSRKLKNKHQIYVVYLRAFITEIICVSGTIHRKCAFRTRLKCILPA